MEDPSPRSCGSGDERFETPRASARQGGYNSSGDERFETPRNNATSRSHASEKNYVTPRDTLPADERRTYSRNGSRNDIPKYEVPVAPMPFVPGGQGAYLPGGGAQYNPALPARGYVASPPYDPSAVMQAPPSYTHHGSMPNAYPVSKPPLPKRSQSKQSTSNGLPDIFSLARHNRLEDVEQLLNSGIPVGIRDQYGNAILSIACQNGLKKMAKLALRRGADINSQNLKGNTPLHFCYMYGYGDSLGEYLVSKGADSSVTNAEGMTCFDLAVEGFKK